MAGSTGASEPTPRRRRGRPRAEEGPAVDRAKILAAATAELARAGYAGLSLRGLARELGVSLGAVQHHFATKDVLWAAVVDQLAGPGPPDAADALDWPDRPGARDGADEPVDPEAALAEGLRRLVTRAATHPGLGAAIWNDTSDGADERLELLRRRVQPQLDAGRAQIEAAIAAGAARPVDPDAVLVLVGLGVASIASAPEALRRLFGIDLDDEDATVRLARAVADVLLHGVLRDPGSTDDRRRSV